MIQIAVCDDEKYYRDKIRELAAQFLEKRQLPYTVTVDPSGEDFLAGEENLVKYDIVFLDISMKDIDGIETAMRIRSFHSGTCIVFVTAFLDYALDGYKADAVRYLMKDSLGTEMEECMAAVLERMELRQVAFPFTGGVQELYTDNILYVESRKHKSVFFCLESERKEYQLYEKMDVIEEKLGQYAFLRIHKSYLVNMKHIRKISSYAVILDTGESLPVPRLKFRAVREAFTAYKGAW